MIKKCICASAIIIKNKKIYLIKHKKLDVWLQPGGHVEENETPEEAAIREAKEETGLDVEIFNLNNENKIKTDIAYELNKPFSIMYEFVDYKTGRHEHFDMIYLTKPKDQSDIILNKEETLDAGWFSENEISSLKLYDNTKMLLERAFLYINKK